MNNLRALIQHVSAHFSFSMDKAEADGFSLGNQFIRWQQ
jgi:hypothetical protein